VCSVRVSVKCLNFAAIVVALRKAQRELLSRIMCDVTCCRFIWLPAEYRSVTMATQHSSYTPAHLYCQSLAVFRSSPVVEPGISLPCLQAPNFCLNAGTNHCTSHLHTVCLQDLLQYYPSIYVFVFNVVSFLQCFPSTVISPVRALQYLIQYYPSIYVFVFNVVSFLQCFPSTVISPCACYMSCLCHPSCSIGRKQIHTHFDWTISEKAISWKT
jgi:hypothetical protein